LFPNSNIFDQSFQDWVEDILEDSSGLDTVSSIEGIKDLIASGADKNLEGGKFKSTAWIASLTNLKDHTEFNTIIKNVVTKTVDDRPNWVKTDKFNVNSRHLLTLYLIFASRPRQKLSTIVSMERRS
jgi:hypothetical protein